MRRDVVGNAQAANRTGSAPSAIVMQPPVDSGARILRVRMARLCVRKSWFASEVPPTSPLRFFHARPWRGRLAGRGSRALRRSQEGLVELRAGADFELAVGVAQVHLDRLDRDEERLRDVLV